MTRKALAVAASLVVALSFAGCGSTTPEGTAEEPAAQQEEQAAQVDFDGAGLEDTGAGTMYLSSAAGTTEDGNVPEIVADGMDLMQIGINYFDGDGSVCTVYVDGMENTRLNAGSVQMQLELTGSALEPGTHKVEVVAQDGDTVTIYKSAEYKIAE